MTHLVRAEDGIWADLNDFDTQPMLFNVANGTIELADGTMRPHRREDMISRFTSVRYDLAARCPLWASFLHRIFDGQQDVIEYMRRVVGYFLTGKTTEQVVFFAEGTGANGKTVFVETVQSLLGEYSQVAQTSLVMANRYEKHTTEIARLHRARLVCMNETAQDAHFDEAKLKDLSGGDKLSGRFLYHEAFDFAPTHKLFIRGNHRPRIRGRDDGIWRRLHLIPFAVQIPVGERDLSLAEKLKCELPGILNWALHGCREWQKAGLKPPAAVLNAVKAYREESDTVIRFINERCVRKPRCFERSSFLFQRYQEFCKFIDEKSENTELFKKEMESQGFRHERDGEGRKFLGLTYQWDVDL